MQSGSGRWLGEGSHNHQAATDDSSKPQFLEILSVPLTSRSALYSSTHFVRCSADGKEATLVSARLDTCGHVLRVSSKERREPSGHQKTQSKLLVGRAAIACSRAPPNVIVTS